MTVKRTPWLRPHMAQPPKKVNNVVPFYQRKRPPAKAYIDTDGVMRLHKGAARV